MERLRLQAHRTTCRRKSVKVEFVGRITAGEIAGDEWAAWYALTPAERFLESMKLWETYLALGGSLEPEPDTQSPFFDPEEWRENAAHGGPGVRVLRRRGV
jgi:hypothetical protein